MRGENIYLVDARTGLYFAGWRPGWRNYRPDESPAKWVSNPQDAQKFVQLAAIKRIKALLGPDIRCAVERAI